MDLGTLLFLTLSYGALNVESETPLALCPDPAAAQAAIAERLGTSHITPHTLRYAFVTDAQSGQSYVRVRLYNTEEAILLERLIPIENGDCSSAPLAIAVIAESYLNAVPTSTPGSPQVPADDTAPAPAAPPQESQVAPSRRRRTFRLEAGGALLTGFVPGFEVGLGFSFAPQGLLHAGLRFQVVPVKHHEQGLTMTSSSPTLYLGSGWSWPFVPWASLLLLPEMGLHHQRAQLRGDDVLDTSARTRFVPSLGGRIDVNAQLDRHLWMGVGGRMSAWLEGARFTVEQVHGEALEVLSLPALDWDVHLFLSYWL
jgi:hypothetical protein